ncbi:MAG TPA: FkbM family methyltransferase [Polyangiaceae bacterium]|nr:FkbM family methyltransferase [Polyangiaceae bacterium]
MLPFFERLLKPLLRRRVQLKPKVQCEQLLLGTEYGGYAVCPTGVDTESVVYSFGVGCDVSFDQGLIAARGVTVHAFDPTPRSIEWLKTQTLPGSFVFHPWGIADFDGTARFHAPKDPTHVSHTLLDGGNVGTGTVEVPVFRLRTIMDKLGHDHIDILKMDIEGAEYGVLGDVLGSGIAISQILIEFHHGRSGVPLSKTQSAVDALEHAGFRAFHASPSGYEFSFLRSEALPHVGRAVAPAAPSE